MPAADQTRRATFCGIRITTLAILVFSLLPSIFIALLCLRALSPTGGDRWFLQHEIPPDQLYVTWIHLTPSDLVLEHSSQPISVGPDDAGWSTRHDRTTDAAASTRLRRSNIFGFSYQHSATRMINTTTGLSAPPSIYTAILIPLWSLFILSVAPFLTWLLSRAVRRSIRNRRLRLGQCTNCAFDLRASTTQCPECGQPIATTLASPSTIDRPPAVN